MWYVIGLTLQDIQIHIGKRKKRNKERKKLEQNIRSIKDEIIPSACKKIFFYKFNFTTLEYFYIFNQLANEKKVLTSTQGVK